jgi:hypothetical protein
MSVVGETGQSVVCMCVCVCVSVSVCVCVCVCVNSGALSVWFTPLEHPSFLLNE